MSLDFSETIGEFIPVVGHVFKLKKFFNDELSGLVEKIGDAEFAEGIKDLKRFEKASTEKEKNEYLRDASIFFRTARTKFLASARKSYNPAIFTKNSVTKLQTHHFDFAVRYQKACLCGLIAAMSYKIQGRKQGMVDEIEESIKIVNELDERLITVRNHFIKVRNYAIGGAVVASALLTPIGAFLFSGPAIGIGIAQAMLTNTLDKNTWDKNKKDFDECCRLLKANA